MKRRDDFEPALRTAFEQALAYLGSLDQQPVGATADFGVLRSRLGRPLSESGHDAQSVIADLAKDVEGGVLGSAGGRFFGWVIGGALPAALAADWLTAVWDQNAALYASGPAAAVVEEVAGQWLKELLGLPQGATFAFTNGCQMAHVTCLAAARYRVLKKTGWDVDRWGLSGSPKIFYIVQYRAAR